MFNINCCTLSVEKTAGKEELHTAVTTNKTDIIDFLRYRSGERRRRALIHGLQEEGEPSGRAQKIHLYQGCNLKIPTPSLLLLLLPRH